MACIKEITKDSGLYKSLLSFLPEDTVESLIRSVNSTAFEERFGKVIETRKGEPTVTSILNISKEAREKADLNKLVPILEREWGLRDDSGKVSFQSTDKLNTMKNLIDSAPIGRLVSLEVSETNPDDTGVVFNQGSFVQREGSSTEAPTLLSSLRALLEGAGIPKIAISSLINRFNMEGSTDGPLAIAEGLKLFLQGKGDITDRYVDFVVLALEGTPGITRLTDYITEKGLAQRILGESFANYQQLYRSDESKIARRAASFLLKNLMEGKDYSNSSIGVYELNALNRLTSLTKNNWESMKRNISMEQLNTAINTARGVSNEAQETMDAPTETTVEAPKVAKTRIEIIADRELASLKKAYKTEAIRLRQFGQNNKEFSTAQKKFLNNLANRMKRGQYKAGIYEFIKRADQDSSALEKRIATLESKGLKERMTQLRNIDSYLSSYVPTINDIINSTDANSSEFQEVYSPQVMALLKETRARLEGVTRKYNALSVNTFLEFLKAEFGQDFIEIKTGARKGKYYFSDLIDNMGPDVGWADLWLNAMASSPDLIGKVLDQAFQRTEYEVYDEVVNTLRSDLQSKAEALFEAQGNRDTSWMYEKDENGIPTGYYIRNIDYAKFDREAYRKVEEFEKKYQDPADVKKALVAWRKENTDLINGVETPKASLYSNTTYNKLTKEQRAFYDAFMELKGKMDEMVGVNDRHKAIQVRKDFIERLTTGKLKDAPKEIKQSAKDALFRRVDDVGYAYKDVPVDFENNPIYSLPIYYVKSLENASDLSTDAYASMFAYASMAVRYKRMSDLVDTLEVGRSVLSRRTAYETSGGKILRSRLQGLKDESFFDPVLKTGEGQNAYRRFEAWMRDQVYQRGAVDAGTTMGVDNQKATNALLSLATIKSLGLNIMVGMASITSGLAFTRTESIAGEFFNMKDMAKADATYFKELMPHLAELTSAFKSNKLSLFLEKFDISQEGLKGLRGKEIERSPIARLFGMKTLMFFLGAGDHYLRARVAIAMANNTKLKDAKGNDISLWDALETKPIDPNRPNAGAQLVLKEGVKKADGSEFTTKDYFSLSRRYGRLIQRVVGNANEGDRAMAKQYILGKLGMQFRNFMVPNWNARFQKSTYDVGLGAETEGYYRTAGRIVLNALKELREGRALSNMNLTDLERANLKRAAADFGQFALVVLAFNLLVHGWKDDENPWHKRMILYQLRRMQTELGAMLTPKEALNILRSPIAATSIIESTYNVATSILWPPDWFNEVESGRFEGKTKLGRSIAMSPISPFQTFYNTMNPEMLMRSLEN